MVFELNFADHRLMRPPHALRQYIIVCVGIGIWYNGVMSEIVFQITEDDTDGGLIARALGHSIVTEADASGGTARQCPRGGPLPL